MTIVLNPIGRYTNLNRLEPGSTELHPTLRYVANYKYYQRSTAASLDAIYKSAQKSYCDTKQHLHYLDVITDQRESVVAHSR